MTRRQKESILPRATLETPDRVPDLRFDLPEWHLRAKCRGMDPDIFFPDVGWPAGQEAKAICATCPVTVECLDDALALISSHWDAGIWGGTNAKERRGLRKGVA